MMRVNKIILKFTNNRRDGLRLWGVLTVKDDINVAIKEPLTNKVVIGLMKKGNTLEMEVATEVHKDIVSIFILDVDIAVSSKIEQAVWIFFLDLFNYKAKLADFVDKFRFLT